MLWGRVSHASLERDALMVGLGTTALNVAGYLFHVVVSRGLGPSRYSAVGAVLAISTAVAIPATGLQFATARRVAAGSHAGSGAAARSSLAVGVVLGAVLALANGQVSSGLHMTAGPVLWLAVWIVAIPLLPVVLGSLQGARRFGALSGLWALSGVVRVIGAWVAVSMGWGVSGAVAAMAASWWIPCIVGAWGHLKARDGASGLWAEAMDTVLPFIGMAVLSGLDIVVARHRLEAGLAGSYAAGSFTGKIVLWAPMAVGVAAHPRFVSGRGSADSLLARPLALVGGATALAAAGVVLFDDFLVATLFGDRFDPPPAVIALVAAAMALLAITQLISVWILAHRSRLANVAVGLTPLACSSVVLLGKAPVHVAGFLLVGCAGALLCVSLVARTVGRHEVSS